MTPVWNLVAGNTTGELLRLHYHVLRIKVRDEVWIKVEEQVWHELSRQVREQVGEQTL